jgi:HSP20 family protein
MPNETIEKKLIHTIVPAVNITETPQSYVVTLDIPGAIKENIKANIENNTLLISADVAEYENRENSESVKQYYREFSLASDIDLQTVNAHYELGVLKVILNKKHQYLPKQITVN